VTCEPSGLTAPVSVALVLVTALGVPVADARGLACGKSGQTSLNLPITNLKPPPNVKGRGWYFVDWKHDNERGRGRRCSFAYTFRGGQE